jgi:predicted DCC family thiol-disulfide oxidoreductase YuxK
VIAQLEAEPHRHWLLLYDADCDFCRRALGWVLRWDRAGRIEPVALQSPIALTLLGEASEEERMASWHLVPPDGERWSAGAAAPPLLRLLPGGYLPARLLAAFPGPTERAYRFVADHRGTLGRIFRAPGSR